MRVRTWLPWKLGPDSCLVSEELDRLVIQSQGFGRPIKAIRTGTSIVNPQMMWSLSALRRAEMSSSSNGPARSATSRQRDGRTSDGEGDLKGPTDRTPGNATLLRPASE